MHVIAIMRGERHSCHRLPFGTVAARRCAAEGVWCSAGLSASTGSGRAVDRFASGAPSITSLSSAPVSSERGSVISMSVCAQQASESSKSEIWPTSAQQKVRRFWDNAHGTHAEHEHRQSRQSELEPPVHCAEQRKRSSEECAHEGPPAYDM